MTLCNPMGCSLPGSSVHGILQARVLVWVAIPFSWGSSRPRDRTNEPMSHMSPALQVDSLLLSHQGSPIFVVLNEHYMYISLKNNNNNLISDCTKPDLWIRMFSRQNTHP